MDYLLGNAPFDALLADRIEWLVEIFHWMRVPGSLSVQGLDYQSGQVQATRVRYLLLILEKNPEWKISVAKTLRSILKDTSALDLFCVTGLPSESGFVSEAMDRLIEKALPRPPHEHDLGELFSRLFPSEHDVKWLERLDGNVLADIWSLFQFGEGANERDVWAKVRIDMEDALLFLTGQIRAFGLAPKLRMRMTRTQRMRDLPFFEVTFYAQLLIKDSHRNDPLHAQMSEEHFRKILAACRAQLDVAHAHLNEYGVSIAIVYQLDRIKLLIRRVETLLEILLGKTHEPEKIVHFLCSLISEASQRKSIGSLVAENLSLISMKIAERSAETGDHYITRTKKEYSQMFGKAGVGGALTSLTAFVKLLIERLPVPYFVAGLGYSINYSLSFIGIYAVGATLATKQPAMTANALAAKMDSLDNQESRDSLVDEIVNLVRSQGAAIFGNVALVIPCSVAIALGIYYFSGAPIMNREQALEVLGHHSILGLSPLHGAFTGVLLWFSSIIAGWIDNWSAYREIPQAIASSRRLKSFLGPSRLKNWVDAYRKHLAGWAGNISLGFLLGMTPKIMGFFGLPLDVRHVTLSTGVISYASASIGIEVFSRPEFWLAVSGIVMIGAMNLGVSFYLALLVALKARRIRAPIRSEIYAEVMERFRKKPTSFFFAPKGAPAAPNGH
ncbi:MAG: site-specific recombinase [Bdellovibrionota bacterium]